MFCAFLLNMFFCLIAYFMEETFLKNLVAQIPMYILIFLMTPFHPATITYSLNPYFSF